MHITPELVKDLEANPFEVLEKLTTKEIASVIKTANKAYHGGEPMFSDNLYEIVVEYLRKLVPDHPVLATVGALATKNKAALPFYMGSLDKVRDDDDALQKWQRRYKGSYTVSDKLDGISCLYYKKGTSLALYSRGDGTTGQDISHLLKYIPLPTPEGDLVFRGELILSKEAWKKVHNRSNPRNTVAGLANSKKPDADIAKLVHLVAYEAILPAPKSPLGGLVELERHGFMVVWHSQLKFFDNESLSRILVERRKESPYEIDGIVVRHDATHPREASGNPGYAFAYKSILTHDSAEVTVKRIIWQVSKNALVKPVLEFDEIYIDGAHITRATAHNAKTVRDQKLGPGSKIIVIRSGSVIPYVKEFLSPSSSGEPSYPDPIEYDWKWNDSNVEIVLKDPSRVKEYATRQLENYSNVLNIKGLGPKLIKKLYDSGIDNVKKLINVSKVELYKACFSSKTTMKIYKQLQDVFSKTTCVEFMVASNVFGAGFGKSKLNTIAAAFPGVLDGNVPSLSELLAVDGIGERFARGFLARIQAFLDFVRDAGLPCRSADSSIEPAPEGFMALVGKNIVFTGFRSAELEAFISKRGGRVSSSVSAYTHILVAKSLTDDSIKMETACELGIPVMELKDFKEETGYTDPERPASDHADIDALREELEKEGIVMDAADGSSSDDNEDTPGLSKRAECVRHAMNWSNMKHTHIFGKSKFQGESLLEDMPKASPKLARLIQNIRDLDALDVEKHGHAFKHMVFSDVTKRGFGAKILAGALAASGFRHAYNKDFRFMNSGPDTFAILAGTQVYTKPISVDFKRKLLGRFNSRPDNVHGDRVRIIVLDSGYKEGIDLFDVKYVHLYEPLLNIADEQQAIGRATRLCGQKGLPFDNGWKLHVYKYEHVIPTHLAERLGAGNSFELVYKELNKNKNLVELSRQLESVCRDAAVDKELTRVFSGGSNKALLAFVRKHYGDMRWPPVKTENMCLEAPRSTALLEFTPSQQFVRKYFQPSCEQKGMLLYNSIGSGKTCCALAAASFSWEVEGYTILWVTRSTLRTDLYKNMFEQSCVERVRDYIQAGNRLPDELAKQKRLLSKSWVPAVSYRQFNNMLNRNNRLYDFLVKRNGFTDPLRKTLIIIDEVHLLTSPSMKEKDKPSINLLKTWLRYSYKTSGENSARVLLMSATPIVDDPMDFIKIVNLTSEKDIPENTEAFADAYLDNEESLQFTEDGRDRLIEDLSGRISYLNRMKDVRQFAQPEVHTVEVEISTAGEFAHLLDEVASLEKEIEGLKENTKLGELKRSMLEKLQAKLEEESALCAEHAKAAEKKQCEKEAKERFREAKSKIDDKARETVASAKEAVAKKQDAVKGLKAQAKEAKKNDNSIGSVLLKRCFKEAKKSRSKPAKDASPKAASVPSRSRGIASRS